MDFNTRILKICTNTAEYLLGDLLNDTVSQAWLCTQIKKATKTKMNRLPAEQQ
jgi:hypothetical protein